MNAEQEYPKTFEGEAKHCCLAMDYALDEHYLYPTITFSFDANAGLKVRPPHIEGAKLTERGRKRKNPLLVNYCPWCGKRLAEDES